MQDTAELSVSVIVPVRFSQSRHSLELPAEAPQAAEQECRAPETPVYGLGWVPRR